MFSKIVFKRRKFVLFTLLVGITFFLTIQATPSFANAPLPNWSSAGYRGTSILPGSSDITTNATCIITSPELSSNFNVVANDGQNDTTGLQAAIDFIRSNCSGGYNNLSLIELPSGTLNITKEIHVDASFLIIRGRGATGSSRTEIVFAPDADTIYTGISDFELGDMVDSGGGNGGWIWPGRGAFRVQTRAVHSSYNSAYASASERYKDFYEGSVNFHWKGGIEIAQSYSQGATQIQLAPSSHGISIGRYVWVGAPNTAKMYQEQNVDPSDWTATDFNRQQIFRVSAVSGSTITLDKPLEFNLPKDSTSDGSAAIGGQVRPAKVIPLVAVEGVGFENFYLTQTLPGHNVSEATFNYNNIDHIRAQHGLVFKWALNSYVNGVHTYMTGSHTIVTEFAKNLQITNNNFNGSWNKGKGGNGYFRGSKVWDSRFSNNISRGLRHFVLQWSASNNVVSNNDFDSDINLHGGWERNNLIENNIVRVPYDHRDCNPNCAPNDETWYPLWWGAGKHAGGWSGATGPRNVVYNNTLQKQLTSGGSYTNYAPYGTSPGTVFQFGWDRNTSGGSSWEHLTMGGTKIETWTGNETVNYQTGSNTGVNANCTSSSSSLVNGTINCAGVPLPTATNTPGSPATATQTPSLTRTSTPGGPTATQTPSPTRTSTPGGPTATRTPSATATSGSSGSCSVVYDIEKQWNDGFNGLVYMTNSGSSAINGWTLTFTFGNGQRIQEIYRAQSYSQSGANATISAPSSHYNGVIGAGSTIDIKFKGSHTGTNNPPTNFKINGQNCSVTVLRADAAVAGVELLTNGGFESLEKWTAVGETPSALRCDKAEKIVANSEICAMQLDPNKANALKQRIGSAALEETGGVRAGETLTLSAFIRARKQSQGTLVKVKVIYADTSLKAQTLKLEVEPGTQFNAGYQRLSKSITIAGEVKVIQVSVAYAGHLGEVWIDDLSLTKTSKTLALPPPLELPAPLNP